MLLSVVGIHIIYVSEVAYIVWRYQRGQFGFKTGWVIGPDFKMGVVGLVGTVGTKRSSDGVP